MCEKSVGCSGRREAESVGLNRESTGTRESVIAREPLPCGGHLSLAGAAIPT